jgi:hypothetical protein
MTEADEIFLKVQEILYTSQGIRFEKLTWTADLSKDLRIAGDDADLLFLKLDEAFNVDWSGLNLGVHFGGETITLPPPWALDWLLYKHQPFRVCDLVNAIQASKWPGTPMVRKSLAARLFLYVLSTLQWLFLISILLLSLLSLLRR